MKEDSNIQKCRREVRGMKIEKYLEVLEKVDKKLKELGYIEDQRVQVITEIVKNLKID
jgi:hypothetical protein